LFLIYDTNPPGYLNLKAIKRPMLTETGTQLRKLKGGEVYKPCPAMPIKVSLLIDKWFCAPKIKKARLEKQAGCKIILSI
jgi:hypothetical protein